MLWLTWIVHFIAAEHDFWKNIINVGSDREPTCKDASPSTWEPCFCPFSFHRLGDLGPGPPRPTGLPRAKEKFQQQRAAGQLIAPFIRKQGHLAELQRSGSLDAGSRLGRVRTDFRYLTKMLKFIVGIWANRQCLCHQGPSRPGSARRDAPRGNLGSWPNHCQVNLLEGFPGESLLLLLAALGIQA